jgi:two-component sensor histidine kinase
MTKFIIIAILLLRAVNTHGQEEQKVSLSLQEVNNLLRSLNKKTADTSRIDSYLKLGDYYLEKEGDEKSDLDSAASFIRQAKEINVRQLSRQRDGLILLYGSSLALKSGNTDAGKQLANQAITSLRTSNDEFHLALAYLELSRCYDSKKPEQAAIIKNVYHTLFQRVPKLVGLAQLDTCIYVLKCFYTFKMRSEGYAIKLDFLDHLLRTYKAVNDKLNEFWTRKEIADIHYQQGKLKEAINELLEIAKEQQAGGHPRLCFTYNLLAGLYFDGGDVEKALYYSLETLKHVHTALDSAYLIAFYSRIAYNYSASGSIAEAIAWNLKTVNSLIAANQTDNIYAIIFQITEGLIGLHRPEEALSMILAKSNRIAPYNLLEKRNMLMSLVQCYAALHNKPMTEKYCQELVKVHELRIKRKDASSDLHVSRILADAYFDIGEHDKAEKYFKEVLAELPKGTNPLYKFNFLFKLDYAKGNYLSAVNHLQAWHLINDSISTATKIKQIEELKIAYATAQKDSLIKFKEANIQLLTKEDELKKIKLRQGGIIRDISFAVVALLVIIMALLYNRYRLKQRTNRKLESQQGEIARQNRSLQHLVDEKEWLLKEIHHRVKNNLQIVMSLLNSQSAYIDNGPALTTIHDSQHRVHAMSLIHQKLYNAANLSSIDMSFYIRELVSYLGDSFNTGQRIRFEYHIDPLEMDVSQAVPLGLILNEAITNAIKYAFPDNRAGIITISLSNTAAGHYLLSVADNGIGMPADADTKRPGSLGMSLMVGLSEDLDGHFSIENNNGTTVKISFENNPDARRPDALTESLVANN